MAGLGIVPIVPSKTIIDKDWCTPAEAAVIVGKSVYTIARWTKAGKLQGRRESGRLYYRRADVQRAARQEDRP